MQEKYEEMMQKVDRQVSAIDLNGKQIINDCKTIIVFLREKLTELKAYIQTIPFGDNTEEIAFFKHHKPMLQGRLIYFHEILRIESQRPLGEDMLDGYYEKQQEEQKMFFDRNVAFFQYYRSGATYRVAPGTMVETRLVIRSGFSFPRNDHLDIKKRPKVLILDVFVYKFYKPLIIKGYCGEGG